MTRLEQARALRDRTDRHYNCCQSVLIPFCPETGLEEEQAYSLGAHFGGGMHCGEACGALTGGLMVLGMLGYDKETSKAFTEAFRTAHGFLDCRDLLDAAKKQNIEKKVNCDGLVLAVVKELEALISSTPRP